MNVSALSVSFLCGIVILSVFLAIKNIGEKEINPNRFIPFFDYEEEKKYKAYENTIKKKKIPAKTALVLTILGGMVIVIVTYVVVGILWVAILSFLGGFFIPNWWCQWHTESNKKMMLKQMEQASEIIAVVIKTGSSLPEAFERAAKEIKEPLGSELIRTATQIRIGVSTSDAFMEFARRIDIPEIMVISIAIELQETGMAINIPALFNQLQSDIRYKVQFGKSIRTITSEMKTAGIVVSIVPFVTIASMRLFSPDFVSPLFDNAVGLSIFGLCVGLVFMGVKWMFNIAKLENI